MEQLISLKESLVCNICQRKFDRKRDLKQHYFHHDVLTCDVCEKVFYHPKNLKRHYKVHTGEKPYECEVCLRRFAEPSSFSKHCRTHSGKREFACYACERKFYTKGQLAKHTATHGKQKSFNCAICLHVFSSLEELTEHLSVSHSSSKPFACNLCSKKFTFKEGLVKHYQTHVQKCKKCSEEFHSKGELIQHSIEHHGSLTKVKKLSDLKSLRMRNQICEKTYQCKECNKKYEQKRGFQRHLLIHEERRFTCDVCSKMFYRKDHLQRHYKLHTGRQPYPCKKCSKSFFDLAKLNKHKLTHSKRKSSVTEESEKGPQNIKKSVAKKRKRGRPKVKGLDFWNNFKKDYSSIENSHVPYVVLERLKLDDTGKSYIVPKEKSFDCNICYKHFSNKWNLNRHCLIHERKGPFKCPKCSKAFPTVDDVKNHNCIHTNGKEFEENLDSQSDVENYYSAHEPDSSLEKYSKLKNPGIKTTKKNNKCKKYNKKYNYKHALQKYFRMHTVGESFICDVCDKRFHRRDVFENHCLSHYDVKPYDCKECGKRFMYKSNLKQHMILHNPGEFKKSFVCEVCMKRFSSSYCLRRHAEIHNRDRSLMCNICQKVFADASRLKRHCDIFKGKQAYGCSECEKIFHYRQCLNRHLLVHNKSSVQCNKCLKHFASKKSLQAHRNLCRKKSFPDICDTSREEPDLNEILNPSITDLEPLHENISDDNNNKCNTCQKVFPNARLFQYHLDTYKGRRAYECTKCVKKFHRKVSLKKHLFNHNKAERMDRGRKSNDITDTSENKYSFMKQLDLCTTDVEHINGIKSKDNYLCNICQLSFPNARLFQYHLDTYKGRQTYECPECVKKFHRRVSLDKHLRIHKALSFQCSVCHKTFPDPVSLEQHIHVLRGDTSYECNIEDMFSGESIKDLISKGLKDSREPNLCTTEKPYVIYIKKEIEG